MDIHKFELPLENLAVVISKRSDKVNSIILHTAYVLSDNVQHIQDLRIDPDDDVIYIYGHEDIECQTIGGRSLDEIADLLVKSGFKGTQHIYVTSCHANEPLSKDSRETMVKLLELKLYNILKAMGIELLWDCVFVESKSTGQSIVVEDSNKCTLYVITASTLKEKWYLKFLSFLQGLFYDKKVKMKDGLSADMARKISYYKLDIKDRICLRFHTGGGFG